MCARLTQLYEQQGEPVLAVAWAQRWLGLQPGDKNAVRAYAQGVARLDSAERVVEAAALLLGLPGTPAYLAEPIGLLLDRLIELDPAEATALAWRTLETPSGDLYIEGVGVVPDITVPITEASALGQVDAVLQAAEDAVSAEVR